MRFFACLSAITLLALSGCGPTTKQAVPPPANADVTKPESAPEASSVVSEGPRRIVYVVDRSGSMADSMDFVKYMMKRSIGELPEEFGFDIIFFSSGPIVEMPPHRLLDATERNKQLALKFIDGVTVQGKSDPSEALRRAFDLKPELIYLLSRGQFDPKIVDLTKQLNARNMVAIHAITFIHNDGEKVLKQVASANGGNYKFFSAADMKEELKKQP
jgi:hypothetical protein